MEPTQSPVNPDTTPAPSSPVTPPAPQVDQAPGPLDFIPEAYRSEPWAQKYKSPDDFYKGVSNMAKLIGQKQIVQGIELPGESATDEDYQNFFTKIGRPESPDKYQLPDLPAPEGLDLAAEKQSFASLAHKAGLNQKQSEILFKEYMGTVAKNFQAEQESAVKNFEAAVKTAFPEDAKTHLDLAKKAAKSLGVIDKLDESGASSNPVVLQVLAKLGSLIKEDNFVKPSEGGSKETDLEKAKRLQASPEYWKDIRVQREVEEIYKRIYG